MRKRLRAETAFGLRIVHKLFATANQWSSAGMERRGRGAPESLPRLSSVEATLLALRSFLFLPHLQRSAKAIRFRSRLDDVRPVGNAIQQIFAQADWETPPSIRNGDVALTREQSSHYQKLAEVPEKASPCLTPRELAGIVRAHRVAENKIAAPCEQSVTVCHY
jgi:hypothetical protein